MTYRGLPYFVAQRANSGSRHDPYASERHVLPDRAGGVRYSAEPHSPRRRVAPYPTSGTVAPAHAHDVPSPDDTPTLSEVEPLRILVAVMLMAVVALAAAFAGIGIAERFTGSVDEALAEGGVLQTNSDDTVVHSTPSSAWEQGAVPQLYQIDSQWADRPYAESTLGAAGSAPLALAMTRIAVTGDRATGPVEVASFVQSAGFADEPDPTRLLTDGAASLGLAARPVEASEQAVRRQVNTGHPIICVVSGGAFGSHPCCIVITDIDRHGKLIVNDPGSIERTERHWTFDEVLSVSSNLWAYSTAQVQ